MGDLPAPLPATAPVTTRARPVGAVSAWALYLGLALTTASMLLVQQFLTRIFSILFNSGLAFLAVSTTFLGLGSAGVCVYVGQRWFAPERIPRLMPMLALAYGPALVAGFVALVALDHATADTAAVASGSLSAQVVRVMAASLLMLPALFLVGLVIALVLRAHSSRVNRLYGADLAGGSLGCLLVLPLMDVVGGDDGIFAIGALAAAGAVLLALAHGRRTTCAIAAAVMLAMVAAPWLNRDRRLVDVRSHSTRLLGLDEWVRQDEEIERTWNSLSRLGFFPTRDGSSLYVRIDSSCQTTLPSTQPAHQAAYVESTDFERLPYVLDRHARYLEIGAGGGRGMVLAKAHGARSITGVEINPGIVTAALDRFPGYGVTPLLTDPAHRYLAEEGRSFARRCRETFDTVTITFIQTGVASGSAAFALSEANLFTVEAFAEFLGLLTERGVFYVYRHGGNEMLRLIAIAREALASLGITAFRDHLYIARNETNRALLMVSRAPFTADETARLDQASRELAVEVVYSPAMKPCDLPPNPLRERIAALRREGRLDMSTVVRLYRELAHDKKYESLERTFIEQGDAAAFQHDYLVDVRPSRDDRPYYFFNGLSHWRDVLLYFDPAGTGILGGTVVLLFWMAAAFTVLIALLIVVPLLLRREGARRGGSGAVILYFSGLGLGYIAVQISFIQRFVLFLGHPVYAISVVLLAFLLCSGLGSACSDWLFRPRRLGFASTIVLLALLLAAYNAILPAIFHSTLISAGVPFKVVISVLLILPLAFLMGVLFPQGIRLVEATAPHLTPWAWGANSAASVLGSIFALILAIHGGFTVVALAAGGIYVVMCLPAAAWMRAAAR